MQGNVPYLKVQMIAIDPGAAGGIASFRRDDSTWATKMPATDKDIFDVLCMRATLPDGSYLWSPVAYLEDLVKFAGRNMPSSAMATYASNWGIVKGILIAQQYKIILVPPKKWQKALGLGKAKDSSRTEWKNKLKQMAQQLYPHIDVTLATADALLILEAAKRGTLG